MDQLLSGIDQVTCYLDDVLIYGVDEQYYYNILIKVLHSFQLHNWEKSHFFPIWDMI